MSSLVIVGVQWGDEGKGKLVDYLTSNADAVVRFQGGNNAGHTLVVDGVTTKLSLVPSGILRPDIRCLIGAGVVVDPNVISAEIDKLQDAGVEVSPERLVLDRDATLILGYHRLIDEAREAVRGDQKLGTTGRGIGPAYLDRAERCAVRISELTDLESLRPKIEQRVNHSNKYLKHVLESDLECSLEEIWESVTRASEELSPYIGNVSMLLDDLFKKNQNIVFEGAQGTLLDQMHGTVPFVTSSQTISGAACTGCGFGPRHIDYTLGVTKAYSTRVGTGPFPTQLDDEIGSGLAERGAEFGTVTGRPRRCGWLDAVAVKRAVRLNGIDSLAITKLDVLSGLEKIRICINYHLDGEKVRDVPSLAQELDRVEPEYIELNGWDDDITGCKKWHELPAEARLYLSTISEIVGCPISIVSVGAEREQTLFSSGVSFMKSFVGRD